MASHDAIPDDPLAVGTTLFECDAHVGEVVITQVAERFRAARVVGLQCGRALLVCPASRLGGSPLRLSRDRSAIYALVGTRIAGVVQTCPGMSVWHRLESSKGQL